MAAIYFTDDDDANDLLANNDFAMLVGLTLYQQVPVEKAFSGPYVLSDRLGGELDAVTIAAMDPDELNDVFREKPALHRFPGSMAKRTQAVAAAVVENYDECYHCAPSHPEFAKSHSIKLPPVATGASVSATLTLAEDTVAASLVPSI